MKDTLIQALKSSGKILMENLEGIMEVSIKQDQGNIVTQADLASEKNIVSIIEKGFPSHSIIAEETGFRNKKSDYIWVVDPLDGTSNFASRIPSFGISIGVLKNFGPVIGGIYLPFYDELYFAEKGKGAYLNNRKISVTEEKNLSNVLLHYGMDFSEDKAQTEFEIRIMQNLISHIRGLRTTNSIVDLGYTADGRMGGYIHQATKIWDLAAVSLIIEEAGGVVTDLYGRPLNFEVNEANYLRDFPVIASGKALHSQILHFIEKSRRQTETFA